MESAFCRPLRSIQSGVPFLSNMCVSDEIILRECCGDPVENNARRTLTIVTLSVPFCHSFELTVCMIWYATSVSTSAGAPVSNHTRSIRQVIFSSSAAPEPLIGRAPLTPSRSTLLPLKSVESPRGAWDKALFRGPQLCTCPTSSCTLLLNPSPTPSYCPLLLHPLSAAPSSCPRLLLIPPPTPFSRPLDLLLLLPPASEAMLAPRLPWKTRRVSKCIGCTCMVLHRDSPEKKWRERYHARALCSRAGTRYVPK
eukprot:886612-Prorocentrum_minimum.AAC.4